VVYSEKNASFLGRLLRKRAPGPLEFLRILNSTRQTEIGGSVEIADTGARRSKGLLGRTGLGPGEGLWIVPCEAVHTFGMKFAIDLMYIDRNRRVVKVRRAVRPGRISAAIRAHSVVELPPGAIASSKTERGDLLELERLPTSEKA
jgi:hypothetical protein